MVDFDVVDLGPTDHVAVGETAPDFTRPLATAEEWADRSLASIADDGPTVLVFTTMAGAFLAKYTLTELRDRGVGIADPVHGADADDAVAATDPGSDAATVVAVSISSPYELVRFLDENELPYGVFSDPANEVAEAYGVVHDLDGMAAIAEPRPAIFVLDDERTIEYAWVAEEWPDTPPYDDVEAAIDDL
ncbi:redoxin domain-containing protein [Halovivax limisalsi]|uniref:redoxin domain-containing protein n=1 Tax=Halovivax limisalsi TaxID=1453760 RepID=UPI001FFC8967|nr:redoxin domain-containing protein [Halovivax limisalsi]